MSQQRTAADSAIKSNVLIKKQLKIERFAELLLQGGLTGVARWTVLGTQKSTNPGTFASSLRQLGINITKGKDYILKDLSSAHATVSFINTRRAERNAEPLSNDVIEYWLKPFIDEQNEVAA
jgi:hypothetical protein